MTNTCINYQTIQAPTRNEHAAFGDTGVVIYSNSVCGARSNFEGGPSALSAGLDRPHAALRLSSARDAPRHACASRSTITPTTLNGWGALGGVIGRLAGNYWAVPVIEGIEGAPKSDQLKHFGAAMASFGSIALFHLVGLTPEARQAGRRRRRRICRSIASTQVRRRGAAEILSHRRYRSTWSCSRRRSSASTNLRDLAGLCDGRQFSVPLLAVTSPQVKPDCRPHGLYRADRGGRRHTCCQACASTNPMRARFRKRSGWKRLATNSAKLVNILGGYGYRPDAGLDGSLRRCRRQRQTGADMSGKDLFKARHAMGPDRARACARGE